MKPATIAAVVVIVIAVGAYALSYHGNGSYTTPSTTATSNSSGYGTPSTTIAASTTSPANSSTSNTPVTTAGANPRSVYKFVAGYNATYGNYLSNSTGWTLYRFTADTQYGNTSACTGTCAIYWKPFTVASNYTLEAPAGTNASAFSVITTSSGLRQMTYYGWPLYYFSGDKASGQFNGEGINAFGGTWYIVTLPKPTTPK